MHVVHRSQFRAIRSEVGHSLPLRARGRPGHVVNGQRRKQNQRALVRGYAREFDDLAPLVGFVGNEAP
jgi:hypothetical protein